MPSQQRPISAEDGEMIGTLAQFAHDFRVAPGALLQCAERHEQAIVLSSLESAPIVLILDSESTISLPKCALQAQR